jgi:hypothetical protein
LSRRDFFFGLCAAGIAAGLPLPVGLAPEAASRFVLPSVIAREALWLLKNNMVLKRMTTEGTVTVFEE